MVETHFPAESAHRTTTRTDEIEARDMASVAARTALLPVAHGTEEMETAVMADVLRRAGARVTVASVEEGPSRVVKASRGLRIRADVSLSATELEKEYDLMALPGGMPGAARLRDCQPLTEALKKQANSGKLTAAICAAPAVVLRSHGMLNGRKATAHPGFLHELQEDSTVGAATENRVEVDGNLITSRGPGTAYEFALAMTEAVMGKEARDKTAMPLLLATEIGGASDDAPLTVASPPPPPPVKKEGETVKVLLAVGDGSEDMESVITYDVLVRGGASVTIASVMDSVDITCANGLGIETDGLIQEFAANEYDLIVLPGGMPGADHLCKCSILIDMLKRQKDSGRLYAAICASPAVVLETHGLLEGKKATAYPAFQSKLKDPSAVKARVVIDGNCITSQGPGTSFDFGLTLVECLFGKPKAEEIKGPMVMWN
eukprot:jgi/Pico_ML_1/53322/g3891.t1